MQHIRLDSGGLAISAAVHRPAGAVRRAVILCPGYLDSKDYPHLTDLANGCAAAGLLAVRFDPAGTWGSAGDVKDYSVTHYLQDLATVDAYIRRTYGAIATIVAGHSLGGFVSMVYAAAHPVSAVVAICAPKQMLGTASRDWQQTGWRESTRPRPDGSGDETYRVPWSFAQDSSQYSALDAVKRYRNLPLLLVAGGNDSVIPPAEVREIYEAAHEPKTYVLLDDASHDIRESSKHTRLATSTVTGWLGTHGT